MVYLIHFKQKIAHAQHYIGFCDGDDALTGRLMRHLQGRGARILARASELGVEWELVRTWEGETRTFERKLKNQKNARRLCPVCGGRRA